MNSLPTNIVIHLEQNQIPFFLKWENLQKIHNAINKRLH